MHSSPDGSLSLQMAEHTTKGTGTHFPFKVTVIGDDIRPSNDCSLSGSRNTEPVTHATVFCGRPRLTASTQPGMIFYQVQENTALVRAATVSVFFFISEHSKVDDECLLSVNRPGGLKNDGMGPSPRLRGS